MKILLGYDPSCSSDIAVASVARRTWPAGTEIRLITATPPIEPTILPGGPTLLDDFVRAEDAKAAWRLGQAAAVVKRNQPGHSVTSVLREGRPEKVIVDEAAAWGADLIVLGTRGHGVLKRLLLGSVSLSIAANAHCSVELVRAQPGTKLSTPPKQQHIPAARQNRQMRPTAQSGTLTTSNGPAMQKRSQIRRARGVSA